MLHSLCFYCARYTLSALSIIKIDYRILNDTFIEKQDKTKQLLGIYQFSGEIYLIHP